MADEEKAEAAAKPDPTSFTDAAIKQIREVAKWLIGAFAAVGVVLAGGSQLADVGVLEGWRLFAAFASVILVLSGIALAIALTVKVLAPAETSLKQLAANEPKSVIGKKIAADPDLLLGHGKSIAEFVDRRQTALDAEAKAWDALQNSPDDEKLKAAVSRASSERERVDAAMRWLLSYARLLEVNAGFDRALKAMFWGAAIAAVGIALFAWAAHPEEEKNETTAPATPPAPAAITVDLNAAGVEAYGERLGAECDTNAVAALALGGSGEALDVITLPDPRCEGIRFTLTAETGTYAAVDSALPDADDAPATGDDPSAEPQDSAGDGGGSEEPKRPNPDPPVTTG